MSKRKLTRLEQAALQARIDQVAAELRDMVPHSPTREDLLKLKNELSIPNEAFTELFGEFFLD